MRIIDRYITQNIILTFLSVILIFCVLYVLIDSASNLDDFISQKISFPVVVKYYMTYLPVILIQTSAMAALIAVLLTFSNLSNHNEVVALRSSGMAFWQISRSTIFLGFVLTALVFFLNENYLPGAEAKAKKIKSENFAQDTERNPQKKPVVKNLTFYGLKNRLYFIDSFDPNTYELAGITIISYDDAQNIKEKIVALNGKWTGIAWKFIQCHVTSFANTVDAPTTVKVYQEKLMDIKETPQDILKQKLDVTSMNIKQLKDYIRRFSNSGAKRALNNLEVDYHQKIAFPMANIIIILVSLPLALTVTSRRAQTLIALGIAILIGFLYYVLNAVGLALGKGGFFPPVVSAWIAPFLFLLAAFYLIQKRFQ